MNRIHRFGIFAAAVSLAAVVTSSNLFAAPPAAQKKSVQVAQAKTASREEQVTGTWTVDQAHTDIAFTIAHMGVSKTRGSFTDFSGTIVANGKKPEASSVNFTIKTASINTGNTARDNHLKSKDFFEVEKYPEITFKSTRVTKRKGGFSAVGNLTMHGVTKQVALPFTVAGPNKGPDGKMHLGVDTAIALNRKDYGLVWGGMIEGTQAVGDVVNVTISLEAIK